MKFYRSVREVVFENPILRLKLAQSSAYTWRNAAILAFLLASILIALFRYAILMHNRELVAALPPEFQADEIRVLADAATFNRKIHDIQMQVFVILWLLPVPYLMFDALNYFFLKRSKLTDDIRALPVTPLQFVFALHDWPYLKCAAILFIAFPFQLLPGTREDFEFFKSFNSLADLILFALTIWVVIFALHRTLICGPYLKDFRIRLWFDLAWGIWLFALLVDYSFALRMQHWNMGLSALLWIGDAALFFGTLGIPTEFISADLPESMEKWFQLSRRTAISTQRKIGSE